MRIRHSALAIAGALAVAGALSGVAIASGTIPPTGGPSASKLAVIERERQLQDAASRQPHGVKHPEQKPATSCPVKSKPLIYPFRFGPFYGGKNLVNVASVVSSAGISYTVFAGALDASPEQGVMLVLRNEDPCASAAGTIPSYLHAYLAPTRTGALTIVGPSVDSVTFVSASGSRGTFNYLTGQFS